MRVIFGAAVALVLAGTQSEAVTLSFENNLPHSRSFYLTGEVSGHDVNNNNVLELDELFAGNVSFGQTHNFEFSFDFSFSDFTAFSMSLSDRLFGNVAGEFLKASYDNGQGHGCAGVFEPYDDYAAIDYGLESVNLDWAGYHGRYCTAVGGPTKTGVGPVSVSSVPLPAGLPLLLAGIGGLGLVARRQRKAD